MTLSEYLESHSISVAEFARRIGAKSRATVHRYIKKEYEHRVPNPKMMLKIIQVTNGMVMPGDFYNFPPTSDKRKPPERNT